MTNSTRFATGDTVRITDKRTSIGSCPIGSGESPYVGKTGQVVDICSNPGSAGTVYRVMVEGDSYATSWTHDALDPVFSRPLVHFDDDKAGRDRSKAREAAHLAISRVNRNPKTNEILLAASNGESVDAYALNEAVLDAMRSATTRSGQSPVRRAQAKQIAHLGHIVQAVLENHADSLPAYESGERSRAVEDMKEAVRWAKVEIDRLLEVVESERGQHLKLREERALLTQAASDERRRLTEEIVSARDSASKAWDSASEAWAEVRRLQTVLDYTRAECVADEAARQRSFGYDDGTRA